MSFVQPAGVVIADRATTAASSVSPFAIPAGVVLVTVVALGLAPLRPYVGTVPATQATVTASPYGRADDLHRPAGNDGQRIEYKFAGDSACAGLGR